MEQNNFLSFDKNLTNTSIKEKDVVWYNALNEPITLHEVFYSKDEKVFRRLPSSISENVSPAVNLLCKHTSGGRLRFKTDSPLY